jgi:uncharacterized protein (TIGR00730 family)
MDLRSVCVFCGSSSRVEETHRAAAAGLGELLAERAVRIVYGGGRVGLMGVLADAALARGGEVVGVIPEFLVGWEVAHAGLTDLRVVGSMHERKRTMADLADAFVVLSGGFGTLDETIEILTWKQLGLHDKPVVLVSVDGFWEPLRTLVAHLVATGFAHPEHASLLTIVASAEEAIAALARAPQPLTRADAKWT